MTTFAERYPVIKGNWLHGRPTYHRLEDGSVRYFVAGERVPKWGPDVDRWEVRTRCGLLIDWWTPDMRAGGRYTRLSARYAQLIGRPCRRCWPASEEESE